MLSALAAPAASRSIARVAHVIDGDMIVTTRRTIRVIGIETPEWGSDDDCPSGSQNAATPSTPSGSYVADCTAARLAGAAPVRVGDPDYGRHRDRHGDGVGCE
jgi:endonuclease YncB( thermonuclease family)